MLGYSLGDVNVQSALQWANVFSDDKGIKSETYQSLVLQARYTEKHSEDPYKGANGEWVIEIPSIKGFLREIRIAIEKRKKEHQEVTNILNDFMDKDLSGALISEEEHARKEFIRMLSKFPRCYDVHVLINFLDAVLGPIWEVAREYGGFEHYDPFLKVLLDIFENLPFNDCHPTLFNYIADKFDDIASYIDPGGGKAFGTGFAATKTWFSRKKKIPDDMLKELQRYSKIHGGYRMEKILK
jgi:siroheme synthase (precorrin-2 oxidase/ferrochelatase)